MSWSSCLPNLNPIENLRRILVQDLYKIWKCYKNIAELKTVKPEAGNNIGESNIHSQTKCMRNRCIAVLQKMKVPQILV